MTPKNSRRPQHFYLFFVQVVYKTSDDKIARRPMNVLVAFNKKALTQEYLQQAHNGAIARLVEENGVDPNDIQDIVISSLSYLGLMTPEEFHGSPDTSTAH